MSRALVFGFTGWSGWSIFYMLLPKTWQTRIVARAWLRTLGTVDLDKTDVLVKMPWGTFRVVNQQGMSLRAPGRGIPGL